MSAPPTKKTRTTETDDEVDANAVLHQDDSECHVEETQGQEESGPLQPTQRRSEAADQTDDQTRDAQAQRRQATAMVERGRFMWQLLDNGMDLYTGVGGFG